MIEVTIAAMDNHGRLQSQRGWIDPDLVRVMTESETVPNRVTPDAVKVLNLQMGESVSMSILDEERGEAARILAARCIPGELMTTLEEGP